MLQKIFLIKILVLVLVVAVIGAGISLFTHIWDPVWNPFRPSAEVVILKMATKSAEIKTWHSRVDFEVGTSNKTEFAFSGNIEGDVDIENLENSKSGANFDIAFSAEGMQFNLAGESKTTGRTSYFKLTTIPALPFLEPMLAMLGIELREFKNQWIKFDKESFLELYKAIL